MGTVTTHGSGCAWLGVGVYVCASSNVESPWFVVTCYAGCVGRKLSSWSQACSLDYGVICWGFVLPIVTGWIGHRVEVMHWVWVKVYTYFCVLILACSHLGGCVGVPDWGARV